MLNKKKLLRVIIFILLAGLFYILFYANHPSACEDKEFAPLAVISAPDAVGVSVFVDSKAASIHAIHRDSIKEYAFDKSKIEFKRTFLLDHLEKADYRTRTPNAGIFITDEEQQRVWLWSNLLKHGAFMGTDSGKEFRSTEGRQPVAQFQFGKENCIIFSGFIPGTDLFDGNLEAIDLTTNSAILRTKIDPFYELKFIGNVSSSQDLQGNDKFRWAVIHKNCVIKLYSGDFELSEALNLKTGSLGVMNDKSGVFIVLTSDNFSEESDSLRFFRLLLAPIPSARLLKEVPCREAIHSVSSASFKDRHIVALLTGRDGEETIEIFQIDFKDRFISICLLF